MICPKCKAEIKNGEKFCSQCGTKVQNTCPNCGMIVDDAKFCQNCGQQLSQVIKKPELQEVKPVIMSQANINQSNSVPQLVQQQQQNHNSNNLSERDNYEEILMEKAKKETLGNTIAFLLVGILCFILFVNNWGYSELMEIVIMCGIVSFFVLAVYFAMAASMGFYGANKYLHKYRQMKNEIGKVEAVKMIEQQYNPNEGFSMLKGGIDATGKGIGAAGGCVGGCFSSIIGFAMTIIMIILVMAFC